MPSRIISPFRTVSLFSGEHDSLLEQVFGQASERGQKPEDTVLSVDIFEDESRYVIWEVCLVLTVLIFNCPVPTMC